MKPKAKLLLGISLSIAATGWVGWKLALLSKKNEPILTKDKLADGLQDSGLIYQLPQEITLDAPQPQKVTLEYSFDPELQRNVEELFKDFRPDHGAFVAMDASSGRILAMVSYSDRAKTARELGNLALRATFPSASVFKVVTAAAAIAEKNYLPNTVIPFNGQNHTLYRRNIFHTGSNKYTRYMTLRQAFAQSVNTVFGKIGAFTIGAEGLREYANRFGFNREIASDLPVQPGRAFIPEDTLGLAEAASGFTRENKMSPVQGAMIAAAVVNDGLMMEPYAIQLAKTQDGKAIYQAEPQEAERAIDAKTANEIRELMRETVHSGTSKKSFRGFFKGDFVGLDVGGKTGSLTGDDPPGKYDWFVGYAQGGQEKIAIATLSIHGKYWRVKSAYLARKAIELYFRTRASRNNVAQEHSPGFSLMKEAHAGNPARPHPSRPHR